LPSAQQEIAIANQNWQVLQAVLSMDTLALEADDESDPMTHELVRLDNKLNLLMLMVGKLLHESVGLPQAVPAVVSAHAVEFQVARDAAKDLLAQPTPPVMLEVFLNPHIPAAVTLLADITLTPGADGAVAVQARFRESDSKSLELMEKFVFRQHRRAVALAKKINPSA
jgi:hypothetical protein